MLDYAAARRNMVDSQLKPNRVLEPRVVGAMAAVPREAFVPEGIGGLAYIDEDLSIGGGRYLMEPMVFGRLLQACRVDAGDLVLDVGCGTGYATAVLARLAATVVGLEDDPNLRARATATLAKLGVDNAVVVEGAHARGNPGNGPYDVIFLGGGVAAVPQSLREQLRPTGGRLAAVILGKRIGRATLIERHGDLFSERTLFDASVPLLPGFAAERGFVF
ncbi:MAG: protein-L-isoaspartate O-methyltransferase [Proteobacteria bacterium]|nr:protein-L-isoaspartate O-methyltransferase [Pseudomonadota bacterium]MDA1132445.1 protein-L-isoaspartate O-methyltransferase [Pseudomonadota bacterium]